MALIQITAPTVEPVTVAEFKVFARIPSTTQGGTTAEDSLIGSLLKVARKQCENICKRQINEATWQIILPSFPALPTGPIDLPRPPLLSTASSYVSITYIDSSAAVQTVPSTAYVIDGKSTPPRIFPSGDNSWADFNVSTAINAVTVQYVSGYSSSTTGIPDDLKLWIMQKTAMIYEYREPVLDAAFRPQDLPRDHFDGLLDPYLVITVSTE